MSRRSYDEFPLKLAKNRNPFTFNLGHIRALNLSAPLWAFWERVLDRDLVELRDRTRGNA